MKTAPAICIVVSILVAGSAAHAEPILAGPGGILDTLYGLDSLVELPSEEDQLWANPSGGAAVALAKWASYTQDIGFLPGTDGGTFNPLFTITGNGFLGNSPSAGYSLLDTGPIFRFANDPSGAPLWSSQTGDNSDGMDHMRTFRITAGPSIGNYVICWEDLPNLGDMDYQDSVVEVSGVIPIPEPSALGMLVLGACVAFLRRAGARRA